MKQSAGTLHLIALALFVFAVAFPAISYAGGENRVGTNSAAELLIPVGARDVALNGSSIATTTGIDAIYWNPAGLARSKYSANAMFSHMSYIADIGVEYLALSGAFEGFGTLGLSLKTLSVGQINITTEDSPDGTGEIMSPTMVNLGLTYSRLLTDRISVGATFTIISEQFDKVASNGFAFSAGVQYFGFAGVDGLSLGVAVKNIGPQMRFGGDGLLRAGNSNDVLRPSSFYSVTAASFELPSTIELGLGYKYAVSEQNALNFSGIFQNNNFSGDEYKLGAEYVFNNMFSLRAGYGFSQSTENSTLSVDDKSTMIFGFSAGAGINYEMESTTLSFNYAYRAVKFFDANHIISIGIGF
jgi:long-subunit fatty acid transport protein